MRRIIIGIAAAMLSLLAVPVLSTAAQAEPDSGYVGGTQTPAAKRPAISYGIQNNGVCNYYDLCVWESVNFTGRLADFTFIGSEGVSTWATDIFNGFIANNDESAINAHLFLGAYICTGPSHTGQCGNLPAGGGGNAAPTYANNSESHYWF